MKTALSAAMLALAASLASAALVAGPDANRRLIAYDRWGNGIAVTNRYDGDVYSVEAMRILRNGATRSDVHGDGYQEMARVVKVDEAGAFYVAGSRHFNGRAHMWVLKYNAQGYVEWEWADDLNGCSVADVDVSLTTGDLWLGAACKDGAQSAVRVAMLSTRGSVVWSRMFQNETNAVESVHVDSSDRIAISATGRGGLVRTTVFDSRGTRIAEY